MCGRACVRACVRVRACVHAIGLTSLFYWSIGVVPFKDDFFTYKGEETGCPYGEDWFYMTPMVNLFLAYNLLVLCVVYAVTQSNSP